MMKKRWIAGALALSMILAGTGYAYWTDSINITTKASTAKMDVTFLDLGLYAQYSNESQGWSIVDGVSESGYVDSDYFKRDTAYNQIAKTGSIDSYKESAKGYNSVDFDAKLVTEKGGDVQSEEMFPVTIDGYKAGQVRNSDNITLTVNNIYPGYAQAFRTDVANVGDVATKLSNIKVEVSDGINEETENMIGVALYTSREYSEVDNKSAAAPVFGLAKQFADNEKFTIGGVDFVRLSALDNKTMVEFLKDDTSLLAIPSKNRMDVYLAVAMDPDAEGNYTTGSTKVMADKDDTKSMQEKAVISIDFNWDQFNEGSETNKVPANILKKQN